MTPQQFKAFKKLAGPLKILYAGVGDKLREPPVVDLMLPTSEVERANTVFASIGYVPKNDRLCPQSRWRKPSKKDIPSRSNSKNTRDKSTSQSKDSSRTSNAKPEKPSITAKLEAFDKAIKQQAGKPKTRTKAKGRQMLLLYFAAN